MPDHCILLRPEHKNEKEKRKANGAGFRTGFLYKGSPPDGWVLVDDRCRLPCYEKQGDSRINVKLVSFGLEVDQLR